MNTGNAGVALNHPRKGANMIRGFNTRFVPLGATGNDDAVQEIGECSEAAHERVVFLSKILHFEEYLSFYVAGLPGIQSFKESVTCFWMLIRLPLEYLCAESAREHQKPLGRS